MTPATYILLLVLGWLALALAILWAMLRLARRARPVATSAPEPLPTAMPTSPVSPGKHLAC
ncbi:MULTISPECIES: hypothetical protein [Pseudomonas]|jgi:hypothetical protein|uniref:Uncharacterized protein n=1 Tax=Pseudomonas oryzihabitans TaxID=47885 RepID=A0A2Z5AAE0_9PSED|nr:MULTISPECIES: hypothetical protein [Pseudomonas]AXA67527.1 hypothetical protein CE139_17445 [Pseudomonas oryzihabitans]